METAILAAGGLKGDGLRSSFHGSWGNTIQGEDYGVLVKSSRVRVMLAWPVTAQPMMKNVNEGKGLFAPIVVVARNLIGRKWFNQLRGKAIALHSQVITEFCKSIGADEAKAGTNSSGEEERGEARVPCLNFTLH